MDARGMFRNIRPMVGTLRTGPGCCENRSGTDAVADVSAYSLWNAPVRQNLALVEDWSNLLVLEVGSGDGRLASALQRRGAEVIPLDRNADGYRRHADDVVQSSRFVGGSIESLPFASEGFDVVVSCSTLQYVDHSLALPEMARVLRCNGLKRRCTRMAATILSYWSLACGGA